MKVLFVTNLPSPYRVDFFNELGKQTELTVIYERKTASDRDAKWINEEERTFFEVYADLKQVGTESSIGLGLFREIKKREFDVLIFGGYGSPSVMIAIALCRLKGIPFFIESDGGFDKKDSFLKGIIKAFLLKKAKGHFITCEQYRSYLLGKGIKEDVIYKYPFTSLKNTDIVEIIPSAEEKKMLREKFGLNGKYIVLAVGRFVDIKGFDVLLSSIKTLPGEYTACVVGGKPTEEYLSILGEDINRVTFVDFMDKESLKEYYRAADLFVMPTREDIWGLVVNEAMSNGLPVISTDRCNAGLELVENGVNGYIVPVDNVEILTDTIRQAFDSGKIDEMAQNSLEKIREYTIEKMAERHMNIFREVTKI